MPNQSTHHPKPASLPSTGVCEISSMPANGSLASPPAAQSAASPAYWLDLAQAALSLGQAEAAYCLFAKGFQQSGAAGDSPCDFPCDCPCVSSDLAVQHLALHQYCIVVGTPTQQCEAMNQGRNEMAHCGSVNCNALMSHLVSAYKWYIIIPRPFHKQRIGFQGRIEV